MINTILLTVPGYIKTGALSFVLVSYSTQIPGLYSEIICSIASVFNMHPELKGKHET